MNRDYEKNIKAFINEISIISENKTELYYILSPLILSKKVFSNKNQLKEFTNNTLKINFGDYVYKSRSVLLGRIIKFINDLSIEEAVNLNRDVMNFIANYITNVKKDENKNTKKQSRKSKMTKQENFFTQWDRVINKNSEIEFDINIKNRDKE